MKARENAKYHDARFKSNRYKKAELGSAFCINNLV